MSTTTIARDIAQIKYDLAELKAITHVTWLRTRPQMEWYFALPVALMAYFMVLSPLRTAGTPVSEAVDTAFFSYPPGGRCRFRGGTIAYPLRVEAGGRVGAAGCGIHVREERRRGISRRSSRNFGNRPFEMGISLFPVE